MEFSKAKLTELNENDYVCNTNTGAFVTVKSLIQDIKDGLVSSNDSGWHKVSRKQLGYNAKEMLEDFVEREEEVYEGLNEYLLNCITEDGVEEIQAVMEKMFGVVTYYVEDEPITLDVV